MLIGDAPELRRRLRDAAEAEERESYEHRMSPEWLAALEPLGTDWRKPHLTDAPWLIVVLEHAYGMQREKRMDASARSSTITCASRWGSPSASCSRR